MDAVKRGADRVDRFFGHSRAFAADGVVALEPAVAHGRKGRDVTGDRFVSRDDRQSADAAELMHAATAAYERAVAGLDMPAEHHVVGEDHVVAKRAVVSDMRAAHQEASLADSSGVVRG